MVASDRSGSSAQANASLDVCMGLGGPPRCQPPTPSQAPLGLPTYRIVAGPAVVAIGTAVVLYRRRRIGGDSAT